MEAAGAVDFLASSRASLEALKSANLLKSLHVGALIIGESGVGKKALARYILPHAPVVSGDNPGDIREVLETNSEVIISDFHKIPSFSFIEEFLSSRKKKIVATAIASSNESLYGRFFAVTIFLPPLRERPDDLMPLAEKFYKEAELIFKNPVATKIALDPSSLDISDNAHSLRRSVFLGYLADAMTQKQVMMMLERYLAHQIGGSDDYRKFLHLYEAPLLRAGLKKFKSQLKISEKFGLNRNTLRKKISDNKDYL